MRIVLFSLLLIVFSVVLPAESQPEVSGLTDFYDRPVSLNAPAQTVVSLTPGITETVFALGYGDRLAGRTSFCNYPPEAENVPVIGSLTEPDLELITAINPDIVIASTHFSREMLTRFEDAGLNIAVFQGPESFEGIYQGVIRPVAAVLGDEKAGEELISRLRQTVEDVSGRSRSQTVKVYYVVGFGDGGDWTAGGDTFIGEMITQAGGVNIARDVNGWSFSLEALIERDPDLILIPRWAEGLFETTPVYSELRAVKNGNVVTVNEDMIVRQGPRIADGFKVIADAVDSVR